MQKVATSVERLACLVLLVAVAGCEGNPAARVPKSAPAGAAAPPSEKKGGTAPAAPAAARGLFGHLWRGRFAQCNRVPQQQATAGAADEVRRQDRSERGPIEARSGRPAARRPQGAPNVLLIMTDDVGFGARAPSAA